MNARDLIHQFAHKPDLARKSGHVSCRNGTLYSYAAPIARHTGNPVLPVLLTSRTYSPTTSKHCSFARQSLSHIRPSMEVHNPAAQYPLEHAANVRDLIEAAALALRSAAAPRLKDTTRAAHIADAVRHRDNAETYRTAFKLPLAMLDKDTRATRAKLAKLTPENVAEAVAKAAEARKKAEAARAKRDAAALEEWTRGERQSVHHQGPARLRVRGGIVETSHGATVPAADALRLWPLAERARKTGTTYTPAEPITLGPYRLDHVSPQGARIGCHFIPFEEMQRVRPEVEAAAALPA